ncbi:LOG family protein [Streptomyces zhihengii]
MRRLAVFLASSDGHDPAYAELAAGVGAELARGGIGLVYGGGSTGLMGVLADAALEAGGEVIGVMPRSMIEREWAHDGVSELVICDSMHERKAIMADRADAFAALPGGLGTLEEIFEVWSWRQLGFHTKPVGLLDAGGFWTPLLSALRGISDTGFLAASTLDDLAVAPDLPGLLEALEDRLRGAHRPAHGALDAGAAPARTAAPGTAPRAVPGGWDGDGDGPSDV